MHGAHVRDPRLIAFFRQLRKLHRLSHGDRLTLSRLALSRVHTKRVTHVRQSVGSSLVAGGPPVQAFQEGREDLVPSERGYGTVKQWTSLLSAIELSVCYASPVRQPIRSLSNEVRVRMSLLKSVGARPVAP